MSENLKKEENGGSYSYTYSSSRRAEVEAIRRKYLPREEDQMERLRRLDREAARRGTITAITVGTVSCIVMGAGMSLCLVWTETMMLPGIVIGLAGMAGMAAAFPLYSRITQRERERIAPEILRLTQELMK